MILVSATEPPALRAIASDMRATTLPESYGCDFLFSHAGALYGVQRKEIADLVASTRDGRLGKELGQMVSLAGSMIVVEGAVRWTEDGSWLGRAPWSRSQHLGLLWSVQARGVWVNSTADMAGTVELVRSWETWTRKKEHYGLVARPAVVPAWGTATNEEYVEWVLQSLPGVGPKRAKDLLRAVGNPLTWRVTRDEIAGVPGIGKKTLDRMWKVFASDQ